ncbi:uncharacterized protein LOC136076917 [Hydra vulgaris]|uniref:Uncharacterized protein LOC136076917 n=1 Tax=Hydra vulgaris TaxID=6087 RepID=A0ABM4BD24_HYDVU
MMFMSTVDQSLPTLELDAQKQIKTLILNAEQRDAINDKAKKRVITGGYGSGKSVVGKEIVKNCVTKVSENPFTLFYICCNNFTLFECEMSEFVDNLKKNLENTSNVTVVCHTLYYLWIDMCEKEKISENAFKENISLPKLLKYLVEANSYKVHFVLEELSDEYVKEEDAIQIKDLINSMSEESLVVLIPESVIKNRELIKCDKKCILQKNCFQYEIIGMKIISLNKLMRFPECNKILIDSAQKTIAQSKTVFNFLNAEEAEANENKFKIDNQRQQQESFNTYSIHATTKNSINEVKESTVESYRGSNYEKSAENHDIDVTGDDFYDNDIDHMSKNLAENTNNKESLSYMETSYSFRSGNIGHAIKGEKPKVVYFPFRDISNKRSAKFLSVILQSLEIQRRTVVICNNIEEVQSVSYAVDIIKDYKAVPYLPHLLKCCPTLKQKFSIKEKLKSHREILITDIKGYSGAEADSIIIIVSPEEVYLRHALVDALARSNFHLTILVLASSNDPSKIDKTNGTIGDVLCNWSENIVEKILVTVCDNESKMWRLTNGSLEINTNCEEYFHLGAKVDFDKHLEKAEFRIVKKNNQNV